MNTDGKPVVGYIGLGIMGGAMVANLLKAGYRPVIHDVRREAAEKHIQAGAVWADSPRAVAEQSEVIFSSLPNLKAIEEVALGANGLIEGIRPGQAFFEMSTNSRDLILRIHAAFAERGAHALDAPVSGGAGGARRARMGIWVGGDKPSYQRYEKVLRAMGDRPTHIGAVGSGLVTKLVNNCASQATQAAIAEVFVLGVKAGADPVSLWEAVRQGSLGRRRTYDGLADEFLPAKYEPPNAALRIVHKDVFLATELARELDVPLRIASLAFADIQEGMNRGWSERDCRSVMLLPQERAGVSIKVSQEAVEDVMRRDPPAPTDTKRGEGA